ncbi:MAG: hypothetical protein V4714_19335 [Bacteroidota bacterium]
MKSLFSLLLLVLGFSIQTLQAQSVAKPLPKAQFTLSSPLAGIELEEGQMQSVAVEINRSKSFNKVKITLSVDEPSLPKGLSVSFEPNETLETSSQMTFQASSSVQPGRYPIFIAGKGLNYSRGFLFVFTIKEKHTTADSK